MDSNIFRKMKLRQGTVGVFLRAPEEYEAMAKTQDYIDFGQKERYGFVHLFVTSQEDYHGLIEKAVSLMEDGGALWISYPKSGRGLRYDLNRDSLRELAEKDGLTACASAALDEKWAALRFKRS